MTDQHDQGPIYNWPDQEPIYDWPDKIDVHEKAMKIISEEAHDSLGLEWQTTDVPELDQSVSPAHAPGLGDALREAAETYYPSDLLANLLDQEMRDLARNALEDLPEGQREALVRAAVDRIRERREDGPEPTTCHCVQIMPIRSVTIINTVKTKSSENATYSTGCITICLRYPRTHV